MSYFNKYGLINTKPGEIAEENTLLYTAIYLVLLKRTNQDYQELLDKYIKYVELCRVGDGLFRQVPEVSGTHDDYISHDSLSGLICVSKEFSLNYHVEIWEAIKRQSGRYDNINIDSPSWDRFLHPRDIIFYGYIAGNWICKYLIWILWIIQAITCIQKWKYRNGNQIWKTDGKILTWLRCQVLGWRLSSKIYNLLNKYCSGFKDWVHVFSVYYKPGHIIIDLL